MRNKIVLSVVKVFNNTLNVSEMMANRDERWLRLAIDYDERKRELDRL